MSAATETKTTNATRSSVFSTAKRCSGGVKYQLASSDATRAVAMPGNAASRRVMEKLGMSLEGPARYRDLDVVRYSISRPD